PAGAGSRIGDPVKGRRVSNPSGSSNGLRSDVLRVLGVVKVATADQIQRLAAPHLTVRHADKPTAAARKEARTRAHRAAAQDLKKHRLVVEAGHSRAGERLWSLTAAGLEAAAGELGRPVREMGGLARGAGRAGATHALCVGETIWALSRPIPDPEDPQRAPDARAMPPGFGTIDSWSTEVALPATGTWTMAGRGGAQADAVLTAPEHGLPLLFVEVDTCHMDAQRIAAKLDKYMRFFKRTVKNDRNRQTSMWRTRWDVGGDITQRLLLPPLLLVFHRIGTRSPHSSWELVAERSREHWQGHRTEAGYHNYDGKVPLVFTTIDALREHGPTAPVFHRAGRDKPQTLIDAVGDPVRDAILARERALHQERARQYALEQAAAREARRPVCPDCAERFSDERWAYTDTGHGRWDPHRARCEACAEAASAREEAEREAARREQCRRCREPRQDEQWETDPDLRRTVVEPDGVHCVACRKELNPLPERGLLGRLWRGY
ncbi:replication-relaxation family protein, partial [Streptomyces sp. NRRL F-2890]|uniref:replication-relaxation family protein n=1 Tax=Streptomyces sp. NRRL F-2890 TaxID=1463845 RepID=UPI001F30B9D1